jgi:hypothetical protein
LREARTGCQRGPRETATKDSSSGGIIIREKGKERKGKEVNKQIDVFSVA